MHKSSNKKNTEKYTKIYRKHLKIPMPIHIHTKNLNADAFVLKILMPMHTKNPNADT